MGILTHFYTVIADYYLSINNPSIFIFFARDGVCFRAIKSIGCTKHNLKNRKIKS